MKNKYHIKTSFLILGMMSLILSCKNSSVQNQPKDKYATFDWFEYKGDDAVYKQFDKTPDQYLNPVLAGFYPDPSIVRAGEDYYLVNSTFSYYPGIPIFHSKDLVNWQQIGNVLDRPSQLNLDSLPISNGVFAPAINYHDSTFYVINTIVGRGGNFFVTAKNPAGPWSDPTWLKEIDGIDPSFFFDDNGKAFIVNNGPPAEKPLYEGHRAIWIQEFDIAAQKLTGPRKVIINGGVDISKKPIWIEGPHLIKTQGFYYLMAAEGGTAEDHSEVIFRSKTPWGPFVPFAKNPILTQRHLDPARSNPVTCTGHADLVETQKGEWWAVFLGCRPYESNLYNTGRQTFMMPVKWTDGWPLITSGEETIPFINQRPDLPLQQSANIPLNGNFTCIDEFNDSLLALNWNFIRTPREKWYEISEGSLKINARPMSIDSMSQQPSFIGRRQQHAFCTASTTMKYSPSKIGDKAGLVIFQNEKFYYLLALTKTEKGTEIEVVQSNNGNSKQGTKILAENKINLPENGQIFLKIEARGKYYDFFYALEPNNWSMLIENVDATLLSTSKAGGFVGAYFGMYAYSVD
jgi:xylan 1,4-beta-xylosidase